MLQNKRIYVISALFSVALLSACSHGGNGNEFIGYWVPAKNSPVRFANTQITRTKNKFTIIEGNTDRFPASYNSKKQTLTIFAPLYGDVTFSYNSSKDELSVMGAILKRTHAPAAIATHGSVAAALAEKSSPFDQPNCSGSARNGGASSQALPDVRGVRAGMPLDAAVRHLECLDPSKKVARKTSTNTIGTDYYGHTIRTRTKLAVGTPRSAKVLAQGRPVYGQAGIDARSAPYYWGLRHVDERFELMSFGRSGAEHVYAVQQHQTFAANAEPTVQTIVKSLVAKYGTPSVVSSNQFVWVHDESGRLLPANNALVNTCAIEGSVITAVWKSICGITVSATVHEDGQNRLLSTGFRVGLVDQMSLVGDVTRLTGMWKAQEEIAREKAAAKAAKIKAPKL